MDANGFIALERLLKDLSVKVEPKVTPSLPILDRFSLSFEMNGVPRAARMTTALARIAEAGWLATLDGPKEPNGTTEGPGLLVRQFLSNVGLIEFTDHGPQGRVNGAPPAADLYNEKN